jgi:hypothetical protein
MAELTDAWLAPEEDHRADRKDGCADPMIMAALFSEMIGAGCITKMNRGAIILFPYDCGALG